VAELSAQHTDPPAVQLIFSKKEFSIEEMLNGMVCDPSTLKEFAAKMEAARGVPAQVAVMLSFIPALRDLKACDFVFCLHFPNIVF
jgi:hypothetical protein